MPLTGEPCPTILADDGDIDANEAPTLLREVDELLMAVAGMRAAVRSRLSTD